jgi:CDP-diacylglycerol--glycerol-3-phosphate 3-phosphatidyltransferase
VGYDLGITPNQITVGRLFFFVPGWLMWFYRQELAVYTGAPWQVFGWAALILITAVITLDVVDGALARETGQVSEKGKILDPAVDKLITYSTLALFWVAITKIGFITLFVLDLASTLLRNTKVKGANRFGKNKALCQNISKFFFGTAVLLSIEHLNIIGNVLIWAAVILATISVGIRILPDKQ